MLYCLINFNLLIYNWIHIYREFDESGLCLLFTLLAFPVYATLHEIEENDDVKYQSDEVVVEELLTHCLVCKGFLFFILRFYQHNKLSKF